MNFYSQDGETKLVKEKFLNPDKLDHHLDPKPLSIEIIEEIRMHGFA